MVSTGLLMSIERKLQLVQGTLDSSSWKKCSIYKLPWCMKAKVDYDDYTPCIVSLGPYHHGNMKFEAMEFHKYRALHCMLNRKHQHVIAYLEVVEQLEQEAREYYEDIPKEISTEKFLEILLIDSCFILEIFLGYMDREGFQKLGYPEKDPMFSKEYMRNGILRDMILLENQIPLVILERLYNLQFEGQPPKHIIELVINVYNPSWVTCRRVTEEENWYLKQFILSSACAQNIGMQHCLDIFRQTLMYCSHEPRVLQIQETRKSNREMDPKNEMIPSVTQLKHAGVKFKKTKESLPFWNINFENGIMEIPQIVINDTSESMLRNLMAFEQCHLSPNDAKITSYIALLDNLVNSPSDVAELFEEDILIHTLGGDEEVANLLNRLAEGIFFSVEDGCYLPLYEQVNGYCKETVHRWRASLVRDYFSSPWAIIAVIAAFLQLTFSFVQTIK